MNIIYRFLLFLSLILFLPDSLFADNESYTITRKFKDIIYESKDFTIRFRARKFRQGELMLIKMIPSKSTNIDNIKKYFLFKKEELVKFNQYKNELIAFFPIHPEHAPGIIEFELRNVEKNFKKVYPINIEETKFQESMVETLRLPKRYGKHKIAKEVIDFIIECEKIKKRAFESNSPLLISGDFTTPAIMKKITSNFYTRRNYYNKKGKPHGGIDIRGKTGDPIFAIQDGKVLIARRMHFEGIFTVIDHGSKIFSLYMHQSKTLVHEGDIVRKGQRIGNIGSTGMSTGPHLHLGVKVDNVLIHPMSAIQIKVF